MTPAEDEAVQYGIDINLIDLSLRLTYEERIAQHESALNLLLMLINAREATHS